MTKVWLNLQRLYHSFKGFKLQEKIILTKAETKLKIRFGLNDEQIYWRRSRLKNLKSEWVFEQEYPLIFHTRKIGAKEAIQIFGKGNEKRRN